MLNAGFDSAGLGMSEDIGDPRRQSKLPGGYATQGQAVSAPYADANKAAAQKINPMNAASQEPGVGERVDDFLNRLGA